MLMFCDKRFPWIVLVLILISVLGCSKKSLKLPSDFAETITFNNKLYFNKEIIYDEYFDPTIGEEFDFNKTKIWKIRINQLGDWKKTVISIPHNNEKQKIGSFSARIRSTRYDYDINEKTINIMKYNEATKDPAPFYYIANLVAKSLKNKSTKLKGADKMLGKQVYVLISTTYEKPAPMPNIPNEKKDLIKIENNYWIDSKNGRIYKFVQYIAGKVLQSYEIKKISDYTDKKSFSTQVPKGTKVTHTITNSASEDEPIQ